MDLLLTVLIFLVVVGFLIFIHELGHFLAAKISKITVHEFALGFGPTLFRKKYRGTIYKLNLLPLGGFVQLEGESDIKVKNGFRGKPFYIKLFVLTAGVVMNLLAAIIFLAVTLNKEDYNIPIPNIAEYHFHNTQSQGSYTPITITGIDSNYGWNNLSAEQNVIAINGEKINSFSQFLTLLDQYKNQTVDFEFLDYNTFETSHKDVQVGGLIDNEYVVIQVADVLAGGRSEGVLKEGDLIVKINGQTFTDLDDFFTKLSSVQGQDTEFTFIDSETFLLSEKIIKVSQKDSNGAILDVRVGVQNGLAATYDDSSFDTYFIKYNKNITAPLSFTYDMVGFQIKGLSNLISNAVSSGDYSEVSQAVGGPLALGNSVNEVVKYQIYDTLFFLTALISLSLAIFNILPIPALDGGQVAIALVESLRRKPLKDETVSRINFAGFAFLMLLSLLITIKDVSQLKILDSIGNFIKSIFHI